MRVAILALSAKSYGGESYIRSIIPVLHKNQDDVEFVVLIQDERWQSICDQSGSVKFHMCDFWGLHVGVVRILWEVLVLPFLLLKLKVDVIFTTANAGPLLSFVPFVTLVRNMQPLIPVSPEDPLFLRVKMKLLRWLTLHSARRARRVIAVSSYVRDVLMKFNIPAETIDVINHGIDDLPVPTEEMNGSLAQNSKFVFSAGKFIRYVNLETLFRAFMRLRRLGYQGDLYFAGGIYDKKYEKAMRELIESLKIDPHVHLCGYVPRSEVQRMMRDCDVFMFPSTLEACPFTLLEAMRQGAAIVATTARPMPEFCGDTALYTRPDDPDGFGEAAYHIISSPDLQAQMRRRARLQSQKYTWAESVRQLIITLRKAASAA